MGEREGGNSLSRDGSVEEDIRPVTGFLHRVWRNRVVQWVVFRGERRLVTIALLAGVFAAFLVLALVRPVDMEQLLSETTTLRTLFATLLSGAILIVSVVSSISSIVLSQEITDIDTEERRIDSSIEFRRNTEDLAEVAYSPGQPAAFLEVILSTVYEQARELGTAVARSDDDEEFRDETQSFASEVLSEAKRAATTLDGSRFGTFAVLSAGLNYDYSWQLNTARRLQNEHGDALDDEEIELLSNLIDTLKLFATGRAYFQSLYYKREVAQLSSVLLYVSLPVIVFISYLLLALDANIIPAVRIGPLSLLSVFMLFAYTVSLAPYVVLTAYVVRIAAITMQTLAAGPFIVRQRDHRNIAELTMDADPDQWDTEFGDEGSDGRRPTEGGTVDGPDGREDAGVRTDPDEAVGRRTVPDETGK
jgi:hypothetical protein